ncbi:hypothetical protein AS850_03410 [Frondihabitans sp. 762G35]|uniref:LamG domain-containing protein n=1 Tax=Frondihabitans sp. 762G35 TaxID=1446794 RepID=UPI000D1FE68B|nr:LamG domain-containing protein [Frondihabitans sp. 762G35]ARC56122.1 hypothetical protein AS850_03410 [Frondihabitans sp. 762G35]
MAKSRPLLRRLPLAAAATVAALLVAGTLASGQAASADSAPKNAANPATPTTVSADSLPTPQIDGLVTTQAIIGATIYAGGEFTSARPTGAAPGTKTVKRWNLLSYNVVTGVLNTSFAPQLNGQVKAIVAAPDGKSVYVAGAFTKIGSTAYSHIAKLNPTTGAPTTTFRPTVNYTVSSLAARGTTVYLGGTFTTVNGKTRIGAAAVSTTNGGLTTWAPRALGGSVNALVVAPDGSKVVAGGTFTSMNGQTNPGYGIAALDTATGKSLPWAMNSTVRDAGPNSGITSLTADSTGLYGSGYVYGNGGNVEGSFRADWKTGRLTWLEDCHGDTYATAVTANAEYVAGHAHFCGNIGGFPEGTIHHGIAFSKAATGRIATNLSPSYQNFAGQPSPTLLNWFPDFNDGTYTGLDQSTWSVAAGGKYVVYGGEFTEVNGVPQQGLARFAIPSLAPNKVGPVDSGDAFVPTASSPQDGRVTLTWPANGDRDNTTLVYKIYRDEQPTPIGQVSADSSIWNRPQVTWTDTGLVPGESHSYRLTATDPFGNRAVGGLVTATVGGSAPTGYSASVYAQHPSHFWRFDQPTGAVVTDLGGPADQQPQAGVTAGDDGSSADGTASSTFDGSSAGTSSTATAASAPSVLSVEAWFRTTGTGGSIVGFGSAKEGLSASADRRLSVGADGRLSFGVYTKAKIGVTSPVAVNDGAWHQAVGTFDGKTMQLYVDGQLVVSRTNLTAAAAATGFWRVGGDTSWTSSPMFTGSIDDVSIYPVALTPAQVQAQFEAARPTAAATPAP